MLRLTNRESFLVAVVLLTAATAADANTLFVNCGGKTGLTSIGAALRVLQYSESHGPVTINVSGACKENVIVQSMDRLTLNATNGSSLSDASGGTLDVISIQDSRDVAINGFIVNAGAGNGNAISCNDFSICRLSGNTLQGAGPNGSGFVVFQQSEATLDGDTLQNNGATGLIVNSGSKVRSGGKNRPFIARGNGQGIHLARDGFAYISATVENNGVGIVEGFNSTLELFSGSVSANTGVGAIVREASVARFTTATISGNGGAGVMVQDQSMVTFNGDTVTGNGGGIDVSCTPQYSATRGTATDVGGGTTNCVEP